MKKSLVIICLFASLVFSSCGSKSYNAGKVPGTSATGVDAVIASRAAEEGYGSSDGQGTALPESDPQSPTGNTEQTSDSAFGDEKGNVAYDETSSVEITDIDRSGEVLDLTAISSTLVYSEVFNMIYEPELYVGKTIIMEGAFAISQDENTGKTYYGCIIQDATACCAQGMEFVPAEDLKYPEDFPELGTTIRITGVYGSYTEDGVPYHAVMDATIEMKECVS